MARPLGDEARQVIRGFAATMVDLDLILQDAPDLGPIYPPCVRDYLLTQLQERLSEPLKGLPDTLETREKYERVLLVIAAFEEALRELDEKRADPE